MIKKFSGILALAVWFCQTAFAQSVDDVAEWSAKLLADVSGEVEIYGDAANATLLPEDFQFGDDLRYTGDRGTDRTIPLKDREILRNVGIVSGMAEGCGLDWADRNFLPMMQWQRSRLPESDRNGLYVAKLGASHGVAMQIGSLLTQLPDFDCDSFRAAVDGSMFVDRFE